MNKDNAITEFLEKTPEIKGQYIKRCRENLIDNTDGAHAIWGLGLVPCIIELLKEHKANKKVLMKSFDFFEQMAISGEDVRELLLYSVLEKLGDDKEVLNIAIPLMGRNTLKYSEQVEEFLGR